MKFVLAAALLAAGIALTSWAWFSQSPVAERTGVPMNEKIHKTDEEWSAQLTPEQYRVTRKKGTERAFSGAYWNNHEAGTYQCVCCGQPLFRSETKFESGTGWPSFWKPADDNAVSLHSDNSWLMRRTEV